MNLEWYDWIGMLGTLMVLAAFFLLQAGRLSGTGIVYQLLNLLGGGGVLVSLLGKFNVSVFLLELAWVLISAYGIARSLPSSPPGAATALIRSTPAAPTHWRSCRTTARCARRRRSPSARRRCSSRIPRPAPRAPAPSARRRRRPASPCRTR